MIRLQFARLIVCVLSVGIMMFIYPATTRADIMVLDFELKDLTIHDNNAAEIERTAMLKPMLEQALLDLGGYRIIAFDINDQLQADVGKGYLYDHHDLVADFGRAKNARWVVVGRVHKPSYLFSYLKVLLIDVKNTAMAADLTVELKGQQDKFLKKSVTRLAIQIKDAIDQLTR